MRFLLCARSSVPRVVLVRFRTADSAAAFVKAFAFEHARVAVRESSEKERERESSFIFDVAPSLILLWDICREHTESKNAPLLLGAAHSCEHSAQRNHCISLASIIVSFYVVLQCRVRCGHAALIAKFLAVPAQLVSLQQFALKIKTAFCHTEI